MSVGPLERFALRVEQLEQALGVRPRPVDPRARRRGKLGPGGIWLRDRLRPGHPEALTREEQDALGEALLAEGKGNYRLTQECLDLLGRGHNLRMELERANSGDMATSSSAYMDRKDGAKG
jgi:hypothetical protein